MAAWPGAQGWWGAETAGSLDLCWPAIRAKLTSFRPQKLKTIKENDRGRHLKSTSSLHMHIYNVTVYEM